MKLFVFPGNLEPDILALGSRDVPYARTPEFGTLVTACHRRLADLLGARDAHILSFTASGTGAVEALFAGWGPRWRRLLVLHAGTFGDRWLEMAGFLGLHVEGLSWSAHDEPPWAAIESTLATRRHDAVMAVHHETSTGELLDLPRLGRLCQAAGCHLLVDAIGSFLADPFAMDDCSVNAAVLSSQKGLCLPPGLAFLAVRPTLGMPADHPLSFYFDPQRHASSFARGQPPWSPAAQLYVQLDHRLAQIERQGAAAAQRTAVQAKATAFRDAIGRGGWSPATRSASACLTALRFTAPVAPLVRDLAAEGWFVLPSPDQSLLRVAHLGAASEADHIELAGRLLHHVTRLGLRAAPPSPEMA